MTQRSIELDGLDHGKVPIPLACRVGPLLMSGGISGKEFGTGKLPEDVETQARNCFANMRRILEAADMGLGNVVKVNVFLADEADRAACERALDRHLSRPGTSPGTPRRLSCRCAAGCESRST